MKPQETNPITGKKGKRYQVNGKKIYEKFLIVHLNERQCVLSTLGKVWMKRECDDVYDEIKPTTSSGRYSIIINNIESHKRVKMLVHRIVAQHFVPKTNTDVKRSRDIVHIKDGDFTNIKPENLMWVNQKEMNRITLFNKYIRRISRLSNEKVATTDVVNSKYVELFLLDEDKYTVPEIISILQLDKYDGIKEALTKKRKELKK